MSDPPAPAGPGQARRVSAVGLLLMLFGAPLAMLGILLAIEGRLDPVGGLEQPGGVLSGVVRDAEGRPLEGVSVDAGVGLLRGGEMVRRPLGASVTTDASGQFAVEVPAARGVYVLRAGSDRWAFGLRTVSLADADARGGGADLVLEPGGGIRVEFLERGRLRGSGTYTLSRRSEGLLSRLETRDRLSGVFEGGVLGQVGLRPGVWELAVRLEGGVEITTTVEVPEIGGLVELRQDW